MATPSTTSKSDLTSLADLLTSTLTLLSQFLSALDPHSEQPTPSFDDSQSPNQDPPALQVLSDASKLLKAHTTKLALLAINKPFTPSAISRIIRELTSSCLPALMSAVQLLQGPQKAFHGEGVAREARARVRRVFGELEGLVEEILVITTATSTTTKSTNGKTASKETGKPDAATSLRATGQVWSSCDSLTSLSTLGTAGLAVQQAEQYRSTLSDAIAELREWREGSDLATEGHGDGLLDSDDEGVDGERDEWEDLFHAAHSLPPDRPDLEKLVVHAEATLKRVAILYTALAKRRLGSFAGDGESEGRREGVVVERLDRLMGRLRRLPHLVDEFALALYDLDAGPAEGLLRDCVALALAAAEEAERDWAGEADRYSEWFRKWREAVAVDSIPSASAAASVVVMT